MKGTVERFLKRIHDAETDNGDGYFKNGSEILKAIIQDQDKNEENLIEWEDLEDDIRNNYLVWAIDYEITNIIKKNSHIKNAFDRFLLNFKEHYDVSGDIAVAFQLYAILYLRPGGNPNIDIYVILPSMKFGNRGDQAQINSIIMAFNLQHGNKVDRSKTYDKELLKTLILCYENLPFDNTIPMPFILQNILSLKNNPDWKLGQRIKFKDLVVVQNEEEIEQTLFQFQGENEALPWGKAKNFPIYIQSNNQKIVIINKDGEKQEMTIGAIYPEINLLKKDLMLNENTFRLEDLFEIKYLFDEDIIVEGIGGSEKEWLTIKEKEFEILQNPKEIIFTNPKRNWQQRVTIPAGKLTVGEKLEEVKEKTMGFVNKFKGMFS